VTSLNRHLPTAAAQSCRLQTQAVCEQRNEELEKILSLKAPMLQQLLGSESLKVSVDQGRWAGSGATLRRQEKGGG
jgi:hypothetical protein